MVDPTTSRDYPTEAVYEGRPFRHWTPVYRTRRPAESVDPSTMTTLRPTVRYPASGVDVLPGPLVYTPDERGRAPVRPSLPVSVSTTGPYVVLPSSGTPRERQTRVALLVDVTGDRGAGGVEDR